MLSTIRCAVCRSRRKAVSRVYLSRVWLDASNRDTMRALSNPNKFHGALEAADPDHGRKLWRQDFIYGRRCVMILSGQSLDLSGFASQFGNGSYEQADYDAVLERVRNGTSWRFRLTANPSICRRGPSGERVRSGHVTAGYQAKWLLDRAERNGFALLADQFDISFRKTVSFSKASGTRVQFLSCQYDGVLTVRDESLFRSVLANGIGHEKAYGQGLLTLA